MNNVEVLSVSQLTSQIKEILEDDFSDISIEGEISNYKAHSSGHKYFTLKDDNATIGAVMWRYRSQLNFQPEDGMKVIAKGNISLYPPQGRYQIDIEEMKPVGQGNLHLAFEALKKKLLELGYFDQERKQAIPAFPQNIGIATSPTGAAVQDMFSTIERRYKPAKIFFRPTLVQGPGAAKDIVKAIEELNNTDADVIIIGRGGGSLEDLWCFNEEITADAIIKSEKPIVSAVGHETDFSISDFVADLRAATPTAAAELVTEITSDALLNHLENMEGKVKSNFVNKIAYFKEKLEGNFIDRIYRRLREQVNYHEQRLDNNMLTLKRLMTNNVEKLIMKNDALFAQLTALNPKAPLEKGYAILKKNGKPINPKKSLTKYKDIEIERLDETVLAMILGREQEKLF